MFSILDSAKLETDNKAGANHNQYVARPPEMSNTAPALKLHSSPHNQAARAATFSALPIRFIGILDTM